MIRSTTLRFTVALLLASSVSALPATDAPQASQPNVLFVVFDDLDTKVGCLGDPFAKTPNLDKLAARGMVFTRAYCQQPICNPSRISFLTGRRPDTLGIWDIPTHLRDRHPDMVTMPQWFKQHGYFAQGIGKIFHNWAQSTKGDPVSWSVPELMHWDRHDTEKSVLPAGVPLPPNLASVLRCESRDVPDEAYFDGRIANLAIDALRGFAEKKQPFFLALGFWKPHEPFNAPKRYWDLYRREDIPPIDPAERPRNAPEIAFHANHEFLGEPQERRTLDDEAKRELRHGYYAAISYADAQLGKVLDELERLDLAGNTVVVVIGDNGLQLGEHTSWGKMTLFDLDARVPLIIAAPGVAKAGAKTRSIAEMIDVYPTLVDLCDLPNPPALDGTSLVPVLKDAGATVKNAALTQHPRPALYWGGGPQALPEVMGYGLKTDRWSYNEWRNFQTGEVVARELYDSQNDSQETVNLAGTPEGLAQIPALAAQLKAITKGTRQ
jgi:iduronate 2-sulfatase